MSRRPRKMIGDQINEFVAATMNRLDIAYRVAASEATNLEAMRRSSFPTFIKLWRGGKELVTIACESEPVTDQAIPLTALFTRAFSADSVAFAFDGIMATTNLNPDTNLPWGLGEMVDYYYAHPGQQVVTETITFHMYPRAGGAWTTTRPYIRHVDHLEWLSPAAVNHFVGITSGYDAVPEDPWALQLVMEGGFRLGPSKLGEWAPGKNRAEADIWALDATAKLLGEKTALFLHAKGPDYDAAMNSTQYADFISEN